MVFVCHVGGVLGYLGIVVNTPESYTLLDQQTVTTPGFRSEDDADVEICATCGYIYRENLTYGYIYRENLNATPQLRFCPQCQGSHRTRKGPAPWPYNDSTPTGYQQQHHDSYEWLAYLIYFVLIALLVLSFIYG